ncbi:Tim44/TimA family putative adaptor protein [bacterium]|nr:Tim44/TimA family putative adaptor protein [bacterium]
MNLELIILVAVAVFVISRLYAVLGQRTGAEPPRRSAATTARTVEADVEEATERPRLRPAFSGPAAAGLEDIANIDRGFDPEEFIGGARRAYEMIVSAFAEGDHAALKGLVDDDVYEAYSSAIEDREKAGAEPLRLVKLRAARIVEASSEADFARIQVSFEADLSDGEHLRSAREIWTFKRPARSKDPNWVLDEVVAAT